MSDERAAVAPPPADHDERRLYPRVRMGVRISYRPVDLAANARRYLAGIAEGLSLGGLFLPARQPFPEGSVVSLRFYPPEGADPRPLSAKAVVRWRRCWTRPRGMGLQFVEFEGLGARRLAAWLDLVLAGESSAA